MIFVIAIETQDFTTIESRIAAWEKRYPLAEFTDEDVIRKIKAILNKDFLSRLIGDYLAAKILHEQEKQKEFYDSLKSIVDKAKKSKDFKTAGKEIRKWKNNLHENGFNLYSFDRLYRARICTLLLLPSKELENQEQATDELKKLKEQLQLQINGKDNIPKDAPSVIICNHNRLMDIFYLPLAFDNDIASVVSARLVYKNDLKTLSLKLINDIKK